MEKKIEEAKAEAEALTTQQLEVQQECKAVEDQCKELRHVQEQDAADIARLKQQRCQVFHVPSCRGAGVAQALITHELVLWFLKRHVLPDNQGRLVQNNMLPDKDNRVLAQPNLCESA